MIFLVCKLFVELPLVTNFWLPAFFGGEDVIIIHFGCFPLSCKEDKKGSDSDYAYWSAVFR